MKKAFSILVFLLIAITGVMAQPNLDLFPVVEDTPVDGGLSVLIALGVGYGIKKLYHKSKSSGI
ncbi:MAG: hypothetical protein WC760_12070 [Bacteroidia bacterium]|jgi:hypothetical protein